MSSILKLLGNLLGEIPTNSVLRERIALIQEQAQSLEKQREQLQRENDRLKERVAQFERKKAAADDFVEHRGALFKRKPDGGFHVAVYCPKCQTSASSPERDIPYGCDCGWLADFKGKDLQNLLNELR